MEGINNILSINHFAEDDVLSVEPVTGHEGDEELGAVGVLASVGHGEEIGLGVLDLEVLICEFFSIDGLASSAVMVGEVSTLSHEVLDDSVEA